MLQVMLILCDCILIANAPDGDNNWKVVVTDALTGKTVKADWTSDQLAAVAALGIGGDDELPAEVTALLYPIAEKATEGWPTECRPMP